MRLRGTPPPRVLALACGLGLVWLAACAPPPPTPAPPPGPGAAGCEAPSGLSDAQRRSFLEHYAPLVLKQADELLAAGHDWLTNFDFDRDGQLANDAWNWRGDLDDYIGGGRPQWRIRPTVYAAAIEVTESGATTLVLLYHLYHAMQFSSIHDWERVEIRLDGVTSQGPGHGETVRYVVITEHSEHKAPAPGELHFWESPADGRHVVVWQAPASYRLETLPHAAELHYVKDDPDDLRALLKTGGDAVVETGRGPFNFHYVFVPKADATAVSDLGAATIASNPSGQASGKAAGQTVDGTEVKRIVYELQDLADLMVTHYGQAAEPEPGFFQRLCGDDCRYPCQGDARHWTCRKSEVTRIRIEEPVLDEGGGQVIPVGEHDFPAEACDTALLPDPRSGYPWKHWFWGTYCYGTDDAFTKSAYDGGPWGQHDYYLHDGTTPASCGPGPSAAKLADGWHTSAKGGCDGRWRQIFPD